MVFTSYHGPILSLWRMAAAWVKTDLHFWAPPRRIICFFSACLRFYRVAGAHFLPPVSFFLFSTKIWRRLGSWASRLVEVQVVQAGLDLDPKSLFLSFLV
jgi:hypothetical protein